MARALGSEARIMMSSGIARAFRLERFFLLLRHVGAADGCWVGVGVGEGSGEELGEASAGGEGAALTGTEDGVGEGEAAGTSALLEDGDGAALGAGALPPDDPQKVIRRFTLLL